MLMVVVKVHWPKVWVTKGGFEYPLVNVAATALALAGPGRYALDAALDITLPTPRTFIIGLMVVLADLVVALATAATALQAERRKAAGRPGPWHGPRALPGARRLRPAPGRG